MVAGRLDGKVAIVTGAGSGIGRAVAVRFGTEGAAVFVNDLIAARAEATAATIIAGGGQADVCAGDVTDSKFVDGMVGQAASQCGHLDVMHNNAGGNLTRDLISDLTDEDWQAVLQLNLTGVFYGIRAALNVMVPQGRGSIISTCSLSGLGGYPRMGGYGAAKAGVAQLTRNAAVEFAHTGVRINAIAPGTMRTPAFERWLSGSEGGLERGLEKWALQIPQGRLGRAEDVAGAAFFLASDDSSFINGVVLPVDGGVLAKLGGPHPE